jgi:hypothetical protein
MGKSPLKILYLTLKNHSCRSYKLEWFKLTSTMVLCYCFIQHKIIVF